jgi:hypothetical protein
MTPSSFQDAGFQAFDPRLRTLGVEMPIRMASIQYFAGSVLWNRRDG